MKLRLWAVLAVFMTGAAALPAVEQAVVEPELVFDTAVVRPGIPFTAGIRLVMEPDWHTYWINPGDGGLATTIEWQLPEGFEAGEIQWPRPKRFGEGAIMNYGYSEEVLLMVSIKPEGDIRDPLVNFAAKVTWLGCKRICVPGTADLKAQLPVRGEILPPHHRTVALFEKTRRELPEKPEGWTFLARIEKDAIRLLIKSPDAGEIEEAYFYAEKGAVIEYAEPQIFSKLNSSVDMKISEAATETPRLLKGVLVVRQNKNERALNVETPIE